MIFGLSVAIMISGLGTDKDKLSSIPVPINQDATPAV